MGFKKGNPGGPGNPHAAKQEKLRAALMRCAEPADFERLGKKLLAQAEKMLDAGELVALRELFDRLLGKPAQAVDVQSGGESLADVLERIAEARDAGK